MLIALYDVIPPLAPYVRSICIMQHKLVPDNLQSFRVLPDTCTELFIPINHSPLAHIRVENTCTYTTDSVCISRMSKYMDVEMCKGSYCIAVCFHAGAFQHFTQNHATELADNIVVLQKLWHDFNFLQDRINNADTDTERIAALQEYLLQKLKSYAHRNNIVKACMERIADVEGILTVKDLVDYTGYSQRQLARYFDKYIGLSPKEFIKINRFMLSLEYIRNMQADSLTDIAYKTGYYDQAHYIHECKQYAGMTPGQILSSGNILY